MHLIFTHLLQQSQDMEKKMKQVEGLKRALLPMCCLSLLWELLSVNRK